MNYDYEGVLEIEKKVVENLNNGEYCVIIH